MAETRRNFEVVGDDASAASPTLPPDRSQSLAIDVLALSLKALSQRALIAAADLFCLFTVATVFWLAMQVIGEPSVHQLVGLGLYAIFVLAANVIVRKKL